MQKIVVSKSDGLPTVVTWGRFGCVCVCVRCQFFASIDRPPLAKQWLDPLSTVDIELCSAWVSKATLLVELQQFAASWDAGHDFDMT